MKIAAFYKTIFNIAVFASILIVLYAMTCRLLFCGLVIVYYIPLVWVYCSIACIAYFIASKMKIRHDPADFAISITILTFFLMIAGLMAWEYYDTKPHRDEIRAEEEKCGYQVKQFYNRYEIKNFQDTPVKNVFGKIKTINIKFSLFSQDYTGLVKIDARETGLNSTGGGIRSSYINVRAGEDALVDLDYDLDSAWRPGTEGKFSINLSDDQSVINDVDWWFSYWIGDSICLPRIGGLNTLAHLMPELSTRDYSVTNF